MREAYRAPRTGTSCIPWVTRSLTSHHRHQPRLRRRYCASHETEGRDRTRLRLGLRRVLGVALVPWTPAQAPALHRRRRGQFVVQDRRPRVELHLDGLAHRALRLLGHLTRLRAEHPAAITLDWSAGCWSISTLRRVTGSTA